MAIELQPRLARWLTAQPDTIIMQPTTYCPLDCGYCYLLNRHLTQTMTVEVAAAVATGIDPAWEPVEIVWHGGEPLAVGIDHFTELLAPFELLRRAGRVQHKVQTGATLITDRWCEVFDQYDIGVGVSLDGPASVNRRRVNRAGRPMFDRTIAGIETLQANGLPFIVLAVVSNGDTHRAPEILDFFRDLGTRWIGFNVEAEEGANVGADTPQLADARRFWRDAFAWAARNPDVTIREVDRLLGFTGLTPEHRAADARHDLIPTIGWNGDVVLLSPELLGVRDDRYDDFVVGNLLNDPLTTLLERANHTHYVHEFVAGLEACKATCKFFHYCQGAHAGDRYFEHGTFTATETNHCRVSVQAPVLALADLTTGKEAS